MQVSSIDLAGDQTHRRPYVRRPEFETGRHHPDDSVGLLIESENLADDALIRSVATLPEVVAQNNDTLGPGPVFLIDENASESGCDSQRRKYFCRDHRRLQTFRLAVPCEVGVPSANRSGRFKNVTL